MTNLLEFQKSIIDEQIQELNKTRMYLQQRINFYEDSHKSYPANTPFSSRFLQDKYCLYHLRNDQGKMFCT